MSNSIILRQVSKCFRTYDRPALRLLQNLLPRRKFYREHWALREIDFTIARGETVGILGRNGAGKSTLLQIVSGILTPTSGSVHVTGRVAALLELGAGFNPEFTGRENVFLNGSILGLHRHEISQRYEEIVEFAGIGDYMDQPVKTYSSGMYIRLAFAIATVVEPEILIIDEALAVGDLQFQAKCFRRFEELIGNGATILFVTHDPELVVRHCDWAILMEQGRIIERGKSRQVANRYYDIMLGPRKRDDESGSTGRTATTQPDPASAFSLLAKSFEDRTNYNPEEYRWGNGEAEITDFLITRDHDGHLSILTGDEPFSVYMAVRFHADVAQPIFGLTIRTPDGVTVGGDNSRDCRVAPVIQPGKRGESIIVRFDLQQILCPGNYLLSFGVAEERQGKIVPLDRRYDAAFLKVVSSRTTVGIADFRMQVTVLSPS